MIKNPDYSLGVGEETLSEKAVIETDYAIFIEREEKRQRGEGFGYSASLPTLHYPRDPAGLQLSRGDDMSDFLSGFGGALGGGLIGGIGQMWANHQNRRMMKKQWKREDSAYQRKAADLEAAGINPMLAGLGGGAGAGAGGLMPMQSPTQGVAELIANAGKKGAETENIRTDTKSKEVSMEETYQKIDNMKTINDKTKQEIKNLFEENFKIKNDSLLSMVQRYFVQSQNETEQAKQLNVVKAWQLMDAEIDKIGVMNNLTREQIDNAKTLRNKTEAEIEKIYEELREITARADIQEINAEWIDAEKKRGRFNNVFQLIYGGIGSLTGAAGLLK